MIFDWYNVFSKTEFLALGLVSKDYTVNLADVGEESFSVFKSNLLSVAFRDVLIPLEFNEDNPTIRAGDDSSYAVFVDDDENVWLGIEVAEE